MNKTKRIGALAAVLAVFALSMLPAQASNTDASPASNTDATTFGRFGTDVDNFLDPGSYGDLDLGSFFAFTRIGTGITKGKLEFGAAAKVSNLYFGLYLDSLTQSEATLLSFNGQSGGLGQSNPAELSYTDGSDSKTAKFAQDNSKPFGTIGLLVGVGGVGYRVMYTDGITNALPTPAGTESTQTRLGTSTIALDVGGFALGPFKSAGLDIEIVQNSYAEGAGTGSTVVYKGNTVSNSTNAALIALNQTELLDDAGSYVAPKIKLGFGFGDLFSLDNDLSFRIYGSAVPGDLDGKVDLAYAGNAIYDVTYDTTANSNDIKVVWNKKFHLEDTITPSVAGTIEASDTLSVGWKAALPITFAIDSNALSAAASKNPGTSNDVTTVSDFYKDGTFTIGLAPVIQAAVKFQPVKVIDLHAGLELQVITWDLDFYSRDEVKASTDADELAVMGNLTTLAGSGYSATSTKSDSFTSTVYAPKLGYAIGFTVSMGPAALDFTFANVSDPTVPGAFYSAIGQGLGSATTSVVLSFKL